MKKYLSKERILYILGISLILISTFIEGFNQEVININFKNTLTNVLLTLKSGEQEVNTLFFKKLKNFKFSDKKIDKIIVSADNYYGNWTKQNGLKLIKDITPPKLISFCSSNKFPMILTLKKPKKLTFKFNEAIKEAKVEIFNPENGYFVDGDINIEKNKVIFIPKTFKKGIFFTKIAATDFANNKAVYKVGKVIYNPDLKSTISTKILEGSYWWAIFINSNFKIQKVELSKLKDSYKFINDKSIVIFSKGGTVAANIYLENGEIRKFLHTFPKKKKGKFENLEKQILAKMENNYIVSAPLLINNMATYYVNIGNSTLTLKIEPVENILIGYLYTGNEIIDTIKANSIEEMKSYLISKYGINSLYPAQINSYIVNGTITEETDSQLKIYPRIAKINNQNLLIKPLLSISKENLLSFSN